MFHAKMHKSKSQLTDSSLQLFYSWNSTTISSSCCGNNDNHPQIRPTKEDQSPHISRGSQIMLVLSTGKEHIILFLSESAYQAQLGNGMRSNSLSGQMQSLFDHTLNHSGCVPADSDVDRYSLPVAGLGPKRI
jgi:hypothetical protein